MYGLFFFGKDNNKVKISPVLLLFNITYVIIVICYRKEIYNV